MTELNSTVKKGKEYDLTLYTGENVQWVEHLYYQIELAMARNKPIVLSGSALRAQVLSANIERIDDIDAGTTRYKVLARVKMVY